jgi:hypothetical protein
MTVTAPDPAQIARFAAMLDENARLHARIDPDFAAVLAHFGRAFAGHAAIVALATPALPPSRAGRLSRHAQAQRAQAWMFARQERFQGQTPPSAAQDWIDAQREIPGVARARIEAVRPVEWKLARGERPKSPNS